MLGVHLTEVHARLIKVAVKRESTIAQKASKKSQFFETC